MRLWSLSPRYLDSKGLLAVWREGLLARAVLMGNTRGYQHHPQLIRFREQPDPLAAINFYLEKIIEEAGRRGYHFNSGKISTGQNPPQIAVSEGQILFELAHLRNKLQLRDPARVKLLNNIDMPELHALFFLVPGPIEVWEKEKVIQTGRSASRAMPY